MPVGEQVRVDDPEFVREIFDYCRQYGDSVHCYKDYGELGVYLIVLEIADPVLLNQVFRHLIQFTAVCADIEGVIKMFDTIVVIPENHIFY